jgi:hypothetical protein
MPRYVEDQRYLTSIPRGPLKQKDVGPLLLQLRQSEVRKTRAIQYAIQEREYLRRLYAQPARQKGWLE